MKNYFGLLSQANQALGSENTPSNLDALSLIAQKFLESKDLPAVLGEPLFLIAEHLATDTKHASLALDLNKQVYQCVPRDSELRQQALEKAWSLVDPQPTPQGQLQAAQWVYNRASQNSELEQQALEKAWSLVDAQPPLQEQLQAAQWVYEYAPHRSELGQQGLEKAWSLVDAQPMAQEQLEAARWVYNYAPMDSELKRQAEAKFQKLKFQQPETQPEMTLEQAVEKFMTATRPAATAGLGQQPQPLFDK